MAAETVLKSTYMDDSMNSVTDESNGIMLYKELSELWTNAGMHARKWLSNSAKVLSEIPVQDRKSEVDLDSGQLPSAKTLGVWWLAGQDVFTFRENAPDGNMVYTKRNFLKKIATLFDPIGLLAPFTIRAKMLLQEMWTGGMDWDEELDTSLENAARAWFNELRDLTEIQVPRCLSDIQKTVHTVSLHTFVDASQDAYGAAVYARYTYQNGSTSSSIIAAKTRVAPTISTSIPRLELMGAIVGIRLAISVSRALEIELNKMTFWSDSVNVLWWIRGRSREFKPFVANRVGEIQNNSRPDQWRYIPTSENPADILSRGMKAEDLIHADKWWKGPSFLLEPEDSWPETKLRSRNTDCSERKQTSAPQQRKGNETSTNDTEERCSGIDDSTYITIVDLPDQQILLHPERYSNWVKLTRIQAWIYRFVLNCQLPKVERASGELRSDEITRAEIELIKQTQRVYFREEWTALSRQKPIPANSKLLGLQPRIDEDGLMRSDGRLKYADFLSYDVRFPVILPRKSWITKLM